MVLETLQPGAAVSVRDLTLENPNVQTHAKFDVERDTPPAIKDAMLRLSRRVVKDASVSFVDIQSFAISKLFYPNDLKDVNLSSRRLRSINDAFGSWLPGWQYVKILDPSFPSPYSDRELEPYAKEAIKLVEDGLGPGQYLDEIRGLRDGSFTSLKMVSPGKIANSKPGEQFISQVNEYYTQIRANEFSSPLMANIGANLRILFWPNPSPYVPAEEDWAKMRSWLRYYPRGPLGQPNFGSDLNGLIMMVRDMQILAADELRITENGVETIFHNRAAFQSEPMPLPEARRF